MNFRLPERIIGDIEARALMHGKTFSAEAIAIIEEGLRPTRDDLPKLYRDLRERALAIDTADGYRLTIHALKDYLGDVTGKTRTEIDRELRERTAKKMAEAFDKENP